MTSELRIERLRMTPDYASMRCGPFVVIIWRGASDLDAIPHVREIAGEALADYPRAATVLAVMEDSVVLPDGAARKAFARANDELISAGLAGIAGVVPRGGFWGACVLGVLTALHSMSRRRYPLQAFGTVEEACDAAARFLAKGVDIRQCVENIERLRVDYTAYHRGLRAGA